MKKITPEEIKKIRSRLGLTQEEFARAVGVNYQTVVRWEAGRHEPQTIALRKIMALGEGEE